MLGVWETSLEEGFGDKKENEHEDAEIDDDWEIICEGENDIESSAISKEWNVSRENGTNEYFAKHEPVIEQGKSSQN